jgi:hypothetical protein
MNGPYSETPTRTARAHNVALWLQQEAAAHRLDPIECVEAVGDRVKLTVHPAAANVWTTWLNLLHGDATVFAHDVAQSSGVWRGVPVDLTGTTPWEWWNR